MPSIVEESMHTCTRAESHTSECDVVPCSDPDDSSCQSEVFDVIQNVRNLLGLRMQQHDDCTLKSMSNCSTTNESDISHSISLSTANNTRSKRKYDKKAYCVFCEFPHTHIVRHWQTKHKNEVRVQELMKLSLSARKKCNSEVKECGKSPA